MRQLKPDFVGEGNGHCLAGAKAEALCQTPVGDLVEDLLDGVDDSDWVGAPSNEDEVVSVATGLDWRALDRSATKPGMGAPVVGA